MSGPWPLPYTIDDAPELQANFDALAIGVGQVAQFSPWTTPALANSWVAYSGTRPAPRYFKTNDGLVYCEGAVKSGSSATATVFTFPAGYRPAYKRDFCGVNDANSLVAGIVAPTGELSFTAGGSTVFTSFQVMFRAEQ